MRVSLWNFVLIAYGTSSEDAIYEQIDDDAYNFS